MREGGREGRKEGESEGGREGGREGGTEEESERGREGGRDRGTEEGRKEEGGHKRKEGERKDRIGGKTLAFSFFLFPIIFSRPLKAPEAMKRMFVVSTATNSPLTLRDRSENVKITK